MIIFLLSIFFDIIEFDAQKINTFFVLSIQLFKKSDISLNKNFFFFIKLNLYSKLSLKKDKLEFK